MNSQLINRDLLSSLKDFGIDIEHSYNNEGDSPSSENIRAIYDQKSDIIFESGEFEGVNAHMPSIIIRTKDALHIGDDSSFAFDDKYYGLHLKQENKDYTTMIFLNEKTRDNR